MAYKFKIPYASVLKKKD